jgi:uncharacterized protein DUF4411
VKRRRSLPLFKCIEPDVYLIDTSAWLNIDLRSDSQDVWKLITWLIEQGRIVACAQVLTELRADPIYKSRLKPYERALQAGDRSGDDIAYLQHVGRVTHDHPAMSKATGWKTRADSYVVALAELEGYIVVSDETTGVKRNRKIPGACQKRGICCITLEEFVVRVSAEPRTN